MKRIHANQAEAIANSLSSILEDKQRASHVLQACVEAHPKWGSRDRNLLYTATYSILRWKQLYSFYAGITTNRFSPWSWIKTWCILHNIEIPEWKELHCPPYETKSSLEEKELPSNSLKHAFPDWIYQLGNSEYGESWEKECRSLNTQADISLRVNRLLTNPEKVQRDLLEKYQIESELMRDYPDALQLLKGRKLNKNPLYTQGLFEVQDANSQRIAPLCKVKAGMKVIDLCAGAGGKSLHLAALMRNKGVIIAMEIEANKLRELERRKKRAKAYIIKPQLLHKETLDRHQEWADLVLIDAPCSGLGTLKRNPEIKWNLTSDRLKELIVIQQNLLNQAVKLIKLKGRLVYATCSILPSENQKQIDHFLSTHKSFTLEEEQHFSPSESRYDGFYIAILKKNTI